MENFYGMMPEKLFELFLPEWEEFMHYLYLPVRIPKWDRDFKGENGIFLPDRIKFLEKVVENCWKDAASKFSHLEEPYIYVSVRRGFATKDNPLNRPGWHCDDFGGTDLNYVWTDNHGTRVLKSDTPLPIDDDDEQSMIDMAEIAETDKSLKILEIDENSLYCFNPFVIHSTPVIPDEGCMRSFFKVSVSTHRYDLLGNSHNYLLDYDWKLYSRQLLRNQPSAYQNKDYSGIGENAF